MFYKGIYKAALVAAVVELMSRSNGTVVVLAQFEHHKPDLYCLAYDSAANRVTIAWGEEKRDIETLRIKNLEHLLDAIRMRIAFEKMMAAIFRKALPSPSCACALIEIGTEDEE